MCTTLHVNATVLHFTTLHYTKTILTGRFEDLKGEFLHATNSVTLSSFTEFVDI